MTNNWSDQVFIIFVILNPEKYFIMTEQIKQIAERIKEIREISGISAETLAIKQIRF